MRRVNVSALTCAMHACVAGALHRQLGIHRVSFAFGVFFIEQWRGNGVGGRSTAHGSASFSTSGRRLFDKARGAGVVATAMILSFKVFGKAIRLRIFLTPSGTYAQDNEQKPDEPQDNKKSDPAGTTNAESDFTACGSVPATPCHYQDVSPDTAEYLYRFYG